MTSSHSRPLPVVGAALRAAELPPVIDWLVEKQRDLEIQDPCYPGVLDGDWQQIVSEARALLDQHGYKGRLGIHAAYDGLDMATTDPLVQAVISQRHQQSLAFAEAIGATHMVLHSPFNWFGAAHADFMPRSRRQPIIDIVHKILTPLLPTAERIGCAFVFEVCGDLHVAPLLDLVRSFGSPYVRLSVDTGHAFLMQQRGGPPPDQWVLEGADVLGHLHLQDLDGQADRHWPIGRGNLNWYAIFRALGTIDADPRLIIETEGVIGSAAWLQQQGLAQ